MSVSPTSVLYGVRSKLARADIHIGDLDERLKPIAQRATDSIVREIHPEAPNKVLLFRVADVPDIDPALGTIIGDALFNIRSALDHLAYRLIELDGGVPCEHTQFPIYSSRLNDKGNPRVVTIQPQIRRQDILDALDAVQPYIDVEDHGHDLYETALWVLRDLCNIDKHRLLLTVVNRLDMYGPNLPWWEGNMVTGAEITAHPLKTNDVVGKFGFDLGMKQDFDPHISLAITLNEGPPGSWPTHTSVVRFLRGLRNGITAELNFRFVPMFPGEPILDLGPSPG